MGIWKNLIRRSPWGRPALEGESDDVKAERLMLAWAGGPSAPCCVLYPHTLFEHPDFACLRREVESSFGHPPEVFAKHLAPIIDKAAEYLQLVPASRALHHSCPGGLLFHSLDVCRRLLEESSSFEPFYPRGQAMTEPAQRQYRFYGRLMLAIVGLTHDFGKLQTDLEIQFVDPSDGRPLGGYTPSPHHQPFSLSLLDCAKTLHSDPTLARYRWRHVHGRTRSQHERFHRAAAIQVLARSGVGIPDTISAVYLPGDSSLYADVIKPVVAQADARSAAANRLAEGNDARETDEESACNQVLYHWARHGLLAPLRAVDGSLFLPVQFVHGLLEMLPDYPDFDGCPTNPNFPEQFLLSLKMTQADPGIQGATSGQETLHRHRERLGVFLSRERTIAVTAWQALRDSGRAPSERGSLTDAVEGAEEAPTTPEPAQPATASDSDVDDDQEVGKLGARISPPPADPERPPGTMDLFDGLTEAPRPSSANHSVPDLPRTLDRAAYPDALVLVAHHLESLPEGDLADPAVEVEVVDGCLTVGKAHMNRLFDEIARLGIAASDFRKLSEEHFSDRWTVRGKHSVSGLVCTPAYTQALLAKTSTSPLLVAQVGDPSPSDEHGCANTSGGEPSSTVAETERLTMGSDGKGPKDLTADGLVAFVADCFKRRSHDRQLGFEGSRLRVPIELVDAYTGDKRLRGKMVHLLEKDDVLVGRTKRFYFFDRNNEKVGRCLDASGTKT